MKKRWLCCKLNTQQQQQQQQNKEFFERVWCLSSADINSWRMCESMGKGNK